MAKKKEKIPVPIIIRGRSFGGTDSIKDVVLYILINALKFTGKN